MYLLNMKEIAIKTVLLFSIVLTTLCPILGIIPLYHSIIAFKRKDTTSVELAYKWVKRVFILIIILWIILIPTFIILFNQQAGQ